MLKKTEETKVMRDPIHGYIHIDLQVVWDCVNAKEFQRLRRIHQLGGNFQVYHTAEHSRFSHSLGVYEIVRRIVTEVSGLRDQLSEYEKATVMLAGLLHDVGHGPFSHAFEAISPVPHEQYTVRVILEDTEINAILKAVDPHLPEQVASIITYSHPKDILNQIVSGQLDADRMDYLLRDAYFTGTSYGNFDLERILRTMRFVDDKIVMKESGIHTVEDYIMARYHMYWQVYFHPMTRSYESILTMAFKRMRTVYHTHPEILNCAPMFLPFLEKEMPSIHDHFKMDEPAALYGFTCLSECEDPILADLSSRLLNRRLFECVDIHSDEDLQSVIQQVSDAGYDPEYYVASDEAFQRPYKPYHSAEGHNIWVLTANGEVRELSEVSDIVQAIVCGQMKEDRKAFYPKDIQIKM